MTERNCGNCRQWQPHRKGERYGVCQFPRAQPESKVACAPVTHRHDGCYCPVHNATVLTPSAEQTADDNLPEIMP